MGAYLAVKSKNILPYPFGDKGTVTRNGITFTDNGDGSITVNGTATAEAWFVLSYENPFTESYQFVGCYTGNPIGASADTYYIWLPQTGHKIATSYYLVGNPSYWRSLRIIVKSGVTANNVVFRPMLYVYDSAKGYDTNYEPYYTYKRVKALSGIKRSSKNLIPYPYAFTNAVTSSGVTITPQSDGGLHIKGKATATMSQNIYLKILNGATMEGGKQYTLYLKGLTKNAGHVYLHGIYSRNNGQSWGAFASTSSGNPKAFTFPADSDIWDYRIQIVTLTYAGDIDEVVYPMLVEGTYTSATMPNYFEAKKCTIRMRPTTSPESYQRVEYIETNVSVVNKEYQYIDTGVIGKSPMTAETKMRWLALSVDAGFLGSRTDLNDVRRFYPFYQFPNATWNIGYKENRNTGATIVAGTDYVLKSVLTRGKQEFYVDGVKVWSETNDFEVDTGYPLRIFGYRNGDKDTTQYTAQARLYYLKIYDGDKLVRYFIPCYRKRDGEIGLLDIVSGVFYTNPPDTGTFKKGADV